LRGPAERTLLATGNEADRAKAYRAFRGRDPDVNALLRRRGFPNGGAGSHWSSSLRGA
jgi:peptidyl-dipeptidase Dcp